MSAGSAAIANSTIVDALEFKPFEVAEGTDRAHPEQRREARAGEVAGTDVRPNANGAIIREPCPR